MRRLNDAGFVVVGTTTTPEWGILPSTETERFGPTRNPWDPQRTRAARRGGSAAAVAAGMVPVAHANDGGGSTRIPAACCGLVGLKPQRGRISMAPEAGESFLAVEGVLTRTVADTALLLDLLAGPEQGDASWAPPPVEPFSQAARRTPEALRVAVVTNPPIDVPLDAVRVQAARDAGGLLESLGHQVEEAQAPWTEGPLLETFTAVFGPLVMLQVAFARMLTGREPTADDMEPVSWALWELVQGMSALDAHLAVAQLQLYARRLLGWMAQYDVVVTPSLAEAPLLVDDIGWETDDPMGLFLRSGAFTPFTAIANVTGQPAISLPLYEHEGLPVGAQLFGRPARRACCCRSRRARAGAAVGGPPPAGVADTQQRRRAGRLTRPEAAEATAVTRTAVGGDQFSR